MDIDRQRKASDRLEELTIVSREFVNKLREGQSDMLAYAMLYYLRRELGYVVRDMGMAGQPTTEALAKAQDIAEAQLWNHPNL